MEQYQTISPPFAFYRYLDLQFAVSAFISAVVRSEDGTKALPQTNAFQLFWKTEYF